MGTLCAASSQVHTAFEAASSNSSMDDYLSFWLLVRLHERAASVPPAPARASACATANSVWHTPPAWRRHCSSSTPAATEATDESLGPDARASESIVDLHVIIGGLDSTGAQAVLTELELQADAAAARATTRCFLRQLHESRVLDERLLLGGVLEVPELLTMSIELHERLRSDKAAAFAAACDALQPLAIQGHPGLFVYRSSSFESEEQANKDFLIKLSFEREGHSPEDDRGSKCVSATGVGVATDTTSSGKGGIQLTVCGIDPPADDLSRGLLSHVREKLEVLTLLHFATLLPRIAQTGLCAADLAFLRRPDVPPLAMASVCLPAALGGRSIDDARAESDWSRWLRACSDGLRAIGWCPLTRAPTADNELLSLLHVPPPHGARRTSHAPNPHKLLCAFLTIDKAGVSRDAGGLDHQVCLLGSAIHSNWYLRLRVWGRPADLTDGVRGGAGGNDGVWVGETSLRPRALTSAAVQLEGLCAALCSRLLESELIAVVQSAAARELNLTQLHGPALDKSIDPVLPWSTSIALPTSLSSSMWASLTAAGVRQVTTALCAACTVGSSAVGRMQRPLLMPPWSTAPVASLICAAASRFTHLAPLLLCTGAPDDDNGEVVLPPHDDSGKQVAVRGHGTLMQRSAIGAEAGSTGYSRAGRDAARAGTAKGTGTGTGTGAGTGTETRTAAEDSLLLKLASKTSSVSRDGSARVVHLPAAVHCDVLIVVPIGHSTREVKRRMGDSSCRLLHVHVRCGHVTLTGFSRVDGSGASHHTPLANVLPSAAAPLLMAFEMQARLTTHALQLLSHSGQIAAVNRPGHVRMEFEEQPSSPVVQGVGLASGARLLPCAVSVHPRTRQHSTGAAVGRSFRTGITSGTTDSQAIAQAAAASINAGDMQVAAEQALCVLPSLRKWWRPLLLRVSPDEDAADAGAENVAEALVLSHPCACCPCVRDAADEIYGQGASIATACTGSSVSGVAATAFKHVSPNNLLTCTNLACPATATWGASLSDASGSGVPAAVGVPTGMVAVASVADAASARAPAAASAFSGLSLPSKACSLEGKAHGGVTCCRPTRRSPAAKGVHCVSPVRLCKAASLNTTTAETPGLGPPRRVWVRVQVPVGPRSREENELCMYMINRLARRLAVRINISQDCAAIHCETRNNGGAPAEGDQLGSRRCGGGLLIVRRRRCVSLLHLNMVDGGINCAVHLLGCEGEPTEEKVSSGIHRRSARPLMDAMASAEEDGSASGGKSEADGALKPEVAEARAAGVPGTYGVGSLEAADMAGHLSGEAAAAVSNVGDELAALYYDAHISMSRPSVGFSSTGLADAAGPGTSTTATEQAAMRDAEPSGTCTMDGASWPLARRACVDAVASLCALLQIFPRSPPKACSLMLAGDAYGPAGTKGQLRGYVHYLQHYAMPSNAAPAAGRVLPCGGRAGALGFGLPPPLDAYDCVAWSREVSNEVKVSIEAAAMTDGGGTATDRCHFTFFLLYTSNAQALPLSIAAEALDVRKEAARVLELLLAEGWESYRCFRVWRQLKHSSAERCYFAVAELATFVGTLPAAVDLDVVFPSLKRLPSLRDLPFVGLLNRLEQLPNLRSCRWHDGGCSHLILLLPGLRSCASLAGLKSGHGDGSGQRERAYGHFIHCELRGGLELRVRACSTQSIDALSELVSVLSESVANTLVCWMWSTSATACDARCYP